MKLDDFRDSEGGFKYEGLWYQDAEDLISVGICKFCGCGQPWAALKFVLGGLALVEELSASRGTDFNAFWASETSRRAFWLVRVGVFLLVLGLKHGAD